MLEFLVIFEGKVSYHIIMSGSRSTSSIVRSEISIGRINSIGRRDRYNYESSKQASTKAGMVYGICIVCGWFSSVCDCNSERGFVCE